MEAAIEIQQLGKEYKLATAAPYIALRDVISHSLKNVFSSRQKAEKFWALEDISLKIEAGSRLGIIGRNGAGKSTLLKIISRITPPTKGEVIVRGRVGSLLEIGTGFHPELTGRENIYLNGSILGLRKREISQRLDEIISFSGVEKFIDSPLKHYSSGMQMRLAFAVAAHLQAEILLIDEVLAVGDMEFQKKCLGKMEEISKNEGRTILYVSHNINSVSNFCEKTILLDKGKVAAYDTTHTVIHQYLSSIAQQPLIRDDRQITGKNIYVANVNAINNDGKINAVFRTGEKVGIRIKIRNNNWSSGFLIGFGLNTSTKGRVMIGFHESKNLKPDSVKEFIAWLPSEILTPQDFSLDISILDHNREILDIVTDMPGFEIELANTTFEGIGFDYGIIDKRIDWVEQE